MRAVGDIGKSAASQLDSWRRTCVEEELWLEVDDGINDQSLYQIFYLEYIHLRCSAEIINLTNGASTVWYKNLLEATPEERSKNSVYNRKS